MARRALLALGLLAVGLLGSGEAGVLVYEGFGGALGNGAPLDGMSAGGYGLNGAWDVTNSPGGSGDRMITIDRNTGTPPRFPHNVTFAPTEKPGNNFQWWEFRSGGGGGSIWDRNPGTRPMDRSIDFGRDDEYFMSFIGRTGGGSDSYLTVGMRESGSNESVNVGWTWNNAGQEPFALNTNNNANGFYPPGGTVVTSGDSMAESALYFFVSRIQTSAAGNDVVSLKAYHADNDLVHRQASDLSGVGSGANQWDVQMSFTSSAVADLMQLAANGAGYPNADEIRLGTDWSDVTGLRDREERHYRSIGLNFVGGGSPGGGSLAATEVAGTPNTEQAYWNNLQTDWHGNSGAVPGLVLDSNGDTVGIDNDAARGIRIQYDSNTVWGTGIGSTTPNERLMRGYLDDHGSDTSQPYIELFNIPYQRYDIVLYVDGDQSDGTDGPYWIEQLDGTDLTPQVYLHDYALGSTHFNGNWTEVPASSTLGDLYTGNFIVFQDLLLSDIRIRGLRESGTRAPINAIQIMEVMPEPTTLTLLGLGSAVALIRRRRKAT
jgi:hypothetical protein